MNKVVVSVRDLEQVKLLMFQLDRLIDMTREKEFKTPEAVAEQIEHIVHRFMETRLEDDRT